MIKYFRRGYQNATPKWIRILHVDDEPVDLEITRVFMKKGGNDDFAISGVLSAEEALEKLEREHFDVIISDYKMPGMNGIEFLEAVRKSVPHIPFILFTVKGTEVTEDALRKGADRCITKGNPASQCIELARAIRELVVVE